MRNVILVTIGLFVGILGTYNLMHALQLRSAYPLGVMHIMHHHLASLRKTADAGKSCPVQASRGQLTAMLNVSREIKPALGGGDPHFDTLADALQHTLDTATRKTPLDCRQLATLNTRIQHRCDDCHREYR